MRGSCPDIPYGKNVRTQRASGTAVSAADHCEIAAQRANASVGQRERTVVLLAAHNGFRYLPEQVASIMAQQDVHVELHISVDLSVDETWSYAHGLSGEYHNLHVLPYGRRFGSAAANFYRLIREVDLSAASYVAFADQDDQWLPWKLRRAQDELRRTGADGYSSNVYAWHEDGSAHLLKKVGQQRRWDHLFSSPGPGCTHVLPSASALELQELLRSQGRAIQRVEYHDWLDYALVRARGGRWHMDERPTMLYRQHGSNQLGANLGIRAARLRWKRLADGWYWRQVGEIARLVGAENELPIRLMGKDTLASRIALAGLSPLLRRDFRGALAVSVSSLVRHPTR